MGFLLCKVLQSVLPAGGSDLKSGEFNILKPLTTLQKLLSEKFKSRVSAIDSSAASTVHAQLTNKCAG
jgi:hypothetical protein